MISLAHRDPPTNAGSFLVLVFVIFILLGREDLRDRVLRLAGRSRLYLTTQALDDAARRVSRYLLMQFAVNAIYGARKKLSKRARAIGIMAAVWSDADLRWQEGREWIRPFLRGIPKEWERVLVPRPELGVGAKKVFVPDFAWPRPR